MWLTALLVIVGASIAVFLLLSWSPHHRGLRRADLPDVVRNVLIDMENGGCCRVNVVRSKIWFSFERVGGSDRDAVLALRIPRSDQTDQAIDDLRAHLETHGFDYRGEPGNKSLYGKVIIPVSNIFERTSGARGAHAARIFLDAIGVRSSAKFNIEYIGDASRRRLTRD